MNIERRQCTASDGTTVACELGSLAVPVRRDGHGGVVRVGFARLRSECAGDAPPIVYLEGGPGIPASWQAGDRGRLTGWRDFLAAGDVILLDHRGVGESTPRLTWKWDGEFPRDLFLTREAAIRHVLEMSRRAREDFESRCIDLGGFTAVECVDDVDDLRRALGLSKISLLGFSFGAQLGLACLRRHPRSVERAVLAGIEGPPHAFKLPLSLDAHLERLGLLETARRVAERLDVSPAVVRVEIRGTGRVQELPVGRFGLGLVLKEGLADAGFVAELPSLLGGVEQGEPSLLENRVRRTFGLFVKLNPTLMLIDGASGATAERRAEIDRQARRSLFGNVANFPFPEVDQVWQPKDLGDDYRSLVRSDRPALLLSGSLDWNSPPAQAEEMLAGLRDGVHRVVEGATHLGILRDPAARRAAVEFLHDRP